jgi:uncharacterized protein
MKLYFDTSALIKKYVNEIGSDKVDELFKNTKVVYVSLITEIETISALRRLLFDKAIEENDYKSSKKEIEIDFNYFSIIDLNNTLIDEAKKLIEKYQIKTLDSIQLASVKLLKEEIDYFVVCDKNLLKYAKNEGVKIINPNI